VTEANSRTGSIQPMGPLSSLLYFGIPAAVLYAAVYLLIPALDDAGLSPFMAYLIALLIPLVLMLMAALIAYRLEGNPPTWEALKDRFRLHRMTGRMWLWTIGLSLFGLITMAAFGAISRALIQKGIIPLPTFIPSALDPRIGMSVGALRAQVDGHLEGNWLVVLVFFVVLFFNIFGEEFWWRGYILPRQELVFGRWTWLVHGVGWCLFHAFKWWDYLTLLPFTLAIAYVSQRLKNNVPAIIAHYVANGVSWLGLLLLVLGVGS
jgi:membrane protease YdiL (CAAX protease family)